MRRAYDENGLLGNESAISLIRRDAAGQDVLYDRTGRIIRASGDSRTMEFVYEHLAA